MASCDFRDNKSESSSGHHKVKVKVKVKLSPNGQGARYEEEARTLAEKGL